MLAAVDCREADVICAPHVDRLVQWLADLEAILEQCEANAPSSSLLLFTDLTGALSQTGGADPEGRSLVQRRLAVRILSSCLPKAPRSCSIKYLFLRSI